MTKAKKKRMAAERRREDARKKYRARDLVLHDEWAKAKLVELAAARDVAHAAWRAADAALLRATVDYKREAFEAEPTPFFRRIGRSHKRRP